MAHLALSSSAGRTARAGPCGGQVASHGASTPFGGLGARPLVPGAARKAARQVAASAWWQLKSPFGSKSEASEGPVRASKGSQEADASHTSFAPPAEAQQTAPAAAATAGTQPPAAATSFAAPAAAAAGPAAASAPASPSSKGSSRKKAPAATSFAAPPAAAAAAAPTAASPPASPGSKVSRRKKKAGKGRQAAEAPPAATSFRSAEVAPTPSAPQQLVFPASNNTATASSATSSAATGSSSSGSGSSSFGTDGGASAGASSASPGQQVINLQNASLTVNPDGSLSISGADAQRVLAALSAVGMLPVAASGAGANGAPAVAAREAPEPALVRDAMEVEYLTARSKTVQDHFQSAIGADDFMQRVEMALYSFGFSGDNCIAMVNLCRDEVTVTLKQKIDAIYGASFSTNGLGGVLTCGTIGMGAGFSHSPVCAATGKERYIFFSLPHISINSKGEVGPMSRPGRPGQSCACGALIKSWSDIRADGLTHSCKIPGVHDAVNPEYSILKQRIARRLRHEGETDDSVKEMSLVDLTYVAERTISDDLEFLISKTVDTSKADYAVVTGVQIHNWAFNFEDDSPSVEFVAPTSAYVVVDGVKTHLNLLAMPVSGGGYVSLIREEGLEGLAEVPAAPTWQSQIVLATPARCAVADNSTIIDRESASKAAVELKELQSMLQERYRDQQRTA
uniref:Low-CO2 inducible protein LCI1850 n=1 Tax=Chlorella sp. ArM0029B TaxID=1415603 RepID=A0A345AZY2_9CHLO|nr:low-CO2 inducible protein LCI1850 [Chlorella sp. ArM0029B]